MTTPASYETVVQELYVAYFGRPADPTGAQNFAVLLSEANAPTTLVGLLSSYGVNPTVTALMNNFGTSTESGNLYGTNITSNITAAQKFVTAVFESLFNRAPLASGLTFWSNAIATGTLNPGAAALSIAAGAGIADNATLTTKTDAAIAFTESLAAKGSQGIAAYQGAAAAADARAFLASVNTLTPSATYENTATTTIGTLISGSSGSSTTTGLTSTPTITLTVAGDSVHLNQTTTASTVNLSSVDIVAYPVGVYGTVAGLVATNTGRVVDTSGNFTLDASGNGSSTTFNFGTGAVSGSSPASSTGIIYTGVTTYVTSDYHDTVTLSAATQNVTTSNDGNTINLGNLAYAGTLNFTAGSGGTDTINATVGGDISGATINGTSSSVAKIALVLSGAGNETLSTAEYNTITNTTGGSITFTGGSFGANTISFANAGTVTAISNVGNYDLSSAGNTITLNNVADNVTTSSDGNTVNLGNLAYTGTLNFTAGSGGTDTINATVGGNISGATINGTSSSVAKIALVLSAAGNETLSTAEYNTITSTTGGSITFTGGSFGADTITFGNAGTVTAISAVGNYDLSSSGNTIILNNVADNVNGAASGNDSVFLGALTYTGTTAFGNTGSDSVHVTIGGDISGGTITSSGATVSLVLSGAGTETLSTAEYNLFNATSITGGVAGSNTITFSNTGTVTANSNVGNYNLSTAGNTITLTAAGDNVNGAASGSDIINLAALTYTGTTAFGNTGSDSIHVTVGGDISGGTITSSGATVALVLSAAGTETLNIAEYNLFNATGITGGTVGGNTIAFSNTGTVTANANVGNYDLSSSAGSTTIHLNSATDNVTAGSGASVVDTIDLAALTYTGTLNFGGNSTDTVDVTIGGNISGATMSASGAQVALALSASGTETLSTEEYNLFNGTGGISGGTAASNTFTFSDAGTVTANSDVNTYDLSTLGNTITLTAAGDNVNGAASGSDIVNLAALTYTGTTAFGNTGSDSIHVTVGGDISGGTITSSGATVTLVLSAAGTETLNIAEYNLFNATGITGGTVGGDTIAFSNTGTVTANANVGNYDLSSSAGSTTIHLNSATDNVTAGSGASVVDTIDLAALTYTGTLNFGGNSTDTVDVTIGGDISGATMNASGAQVALALSASGTETLSTEEYNLFNGTGGISGGTAASNTFTFSDAGTVTANSDVNTYDLSTLGNTITLTAAGDNVNGAASGNNFVVIPQSGFTGTLAFGTSGTDVVEAPTNGDFSGLTLTSGGATLELMITGVATGVPSGSTTTTEIYNEFTTGPHAGGIVFPTSGDTNAADYKMTFSDQGTVIDNADIGNYYLNAIINSGSDAYTFTISHNAADHITEYSTSTGGSTYNINVATFTGSLTLGSSGNDTIAVSGNRDISGATITSGGTTASLSISGSSTVTVSSAEQNLFHNAPSAIATTGVTTLNVADSTHAINLNAQENNIANVGLNADNNTVNISVGAASVSSGAAGFNQTVIENGSGGGNTFNIDNGGTGATILNASDATHYVTINNFNTTSDNINLTLSNNAQSAGEQNISDSGNDTVTVGVNSVLVETNLGGLSGFSSTFNATDLTSAKNYMLNAINASTATSGEYSFVIDSSQGAAIYEIHITSGGGSGTIDGVQLVGVVHGVGAFNLTGHINPV